MSENYGPYVQMGTLAERMAAHYQTDANLELGPHLSHYMEEVEVNIAAHSFDHVGFMKKIHDRLEKGLMATSSLRHNEFLHAVIAALQDRINRH
ncbi:hypothetical protein [Agrobacterium rosae]|uniref:Uncharacterized protein n=1 Tax=Agrobacterium rosae TaxID=1972867 RepID=A0AAW9FH74_9HYPH|nr:hypothetical protein [Agrobacterium rosae]MDX8303803.1 hypothetical protein [Agrobacterium rosae]POO56742.1 hypothetical protein CTT39_08700 [Agrobacterium rosae]